MDGYPNNPDGFLDSSRTSKKKVRINLTGQFNQSMSENTPYSISDGKGHVQFAQQDTSNPTDPTQSSTYSPSSSPKTPKQMRMIESHHQTTTPTTIKEMENIRSHLRNILHPSEDMNELTKLDAGPIPLYDDYEDPAINREAETLLKTYFPHSSPLDMDTNGPYEGLRSGYTHQDDDTSLLALQSENTILQDRMSKEKSRRKHCETQIQVLQHKLLETQQQLAVSMATDRKKEIMIEQLDKTLAKVVDGWKKHEEERVKVIRTLKDENNSLQRAHSRHEEVLSQFEHELSVAVEALTKEQQRNDETGKEKQAQLKTIQLKFESQEADLKEFTDRNGQLQMENEQLSADLKSLKQEFDLQNMKFEQDTKILEERISVITNEYSQDNRKIELLLETKTFEAEQTKARMKEIMAELEKAQNIQLQLESNIESKQQKQDALENELEEMNSKNESLQNQNNRDLRLKLEEEFNIKINHLHKEINRTETELRIAHKKQIQEIMMNHQHDLHTHINQYREDLKSKESNFVKAKEIYERRLIDLKEENNQLKSTTENLTHQRQEIINSLQTRMRQQCEETISLFADDQSIFSSNAGQLSTVTHSQPINYAQKRGNEDQHSLPRPIPTLTSVTPEAVAGNTRLSVVKQPSLQAQLHENTIQQKLVNDRQVATPQIETNHSSGGFAYASTGKRDPSINEENWLMKTETPLSKQKLRETTEMLDTEIKRKISQHSPDRDDDELSVLIHKLLKRSPTDENTKHEQTHDNQLRHNDMALTPVFTNNPQQHAFKRSVVQTNENRRQHKSIIQNQSLDTAVRDAHQNSDECPSVQSVGVEQVSGILKMLGLTLSSEADHYLNSMADLTAHGSSIPAQSRYDHEVPVKLSRDAYQQEQLQRNDDLNASVRRKGQRRTSPNRQLQFDSKVTRPVHPSNRGKTMARDSTKISTGAGIRSSHARRNMAWK